MTPRRRGEGATVGHASSHVDPAAVVHRRCPDRRALGAEPYDVLSREDDRTARPRRSARPRAACRDGRRRLAAERAPVRERRRRLPPGAHHDASGSRHAGSTQPVTRRTPLRTGARGLERRPGVRPSCAAPAPSPPRRPGNEQRVATTHAIPAASTTSAGSTVGPGRSGRAGNGDQGVTGRVVGEPSRAEGVCRAADAPPWVGTRRAVERRSAAVPFRRRREITCPGRVDHQGRRRVDHLRRRRSPRTPFLPTRAPGTGPRRAPGRGRP